MKPLTGSTTIAIPLASADRPVWLHVGALLDGVSTRPLHDAHVVYTREKILFVGVDGQTPPRDDLGRAQTKPDYHAPDATLLPGLIEAHAHLFLEGGELNIDQRAAYLKQSHTELLTRAHSRLDKLVRLGIAGVRDAGDKDGVGLALSRLYDERLSSAGFQPAPWNASVPPAPSGSGIPQILPCAFAKQAGMPALPQTRYPLMPYVESPGAAIHRRGRYGSFMADALENYPSLRACVEARVAAGADRIKLIPTGIINFKQGQVTTEPQMPTEDVAEIVAASKALGRQTFAHASGDVGIDRVIDGGVDSIEHGFFVRDDQLARMRDRQIAWVPTFAPVQAQIDHADLMGWGPEIVANLRKILERHAASLMKAHALGVTIIAGSDAGSYGVAHGIGLLYELELMERAGVSSLAVINAATGAGAGRFGYKERIGAIKPGGSSRFIVTEHSPLETVTNLRKTRMIVFDGDVFETAEAFDTMGL